jgi:hypothetical protein
VNALLQTNRPLIVVAVGESCDIASCAAAPAYLATHGFDPASLRVAVPLRLGLSSDR